MTTVKIIQVFEHYDEEYVATGSDIAQVTDWETISEVDLATLRRWLHLKNRTGVHGSYKEFPHYAVLVIPEEPISAIASVGQVVEEYRKEEEREAAKRKQQKDRYEATKMERKRKQLEKLQRELAAGTLGYDATTRESR